MADAFLIKLLLSFIVGSGWVTLTTIIAERFGSKIGGFIGGLPSTALVSFFFIGLVETPQIASQATTVFPLSTAFSILFLVLYVVLVKRGLFVGLLGALFGWFALSSLVIIFNVQNFAFSLIVWLTILLFSYYILEKKIKLASYGKLKIKYNASQIAWRALFSGSIIVFAVFMTKVGGPIFGGIFSAFPAIYTSTLVITYNSRGVEFSRALTKPLMVSAAINTIVYATAVRYFYPASGLVVGTIIAYAIAMISAYFTYNFISKKMN